jgi:hypothetical protein
MKKMTTLLTRWRWLTYLLLSYYSHVNGISIIIAKQAPRIHVMAHANNNIKENVINK